MGNYTAVKQTLYKVYLTKVYQGTGIRKSSKLSFLDEPFSGEAKAVINSAYKVLKREEENISLMEIPIKMVVPGNSKLEDVLSRSYESCHFPNIFSFNAQTQNFEFH